MKTLILIAGFFVAILIQGCVAYAEPVGGYYARGGIWYYRDGGGHEWHENHRYHHVDDGHDHDHH